MSKLRVAYVLAYSAVGGLLAVVSCSPAPVSKPAEIFNDTGGMGAGATAGVGAGATAGVGAGATAGVGAGATAGIGAGATAGIGAGATAGIGAGATAGIGAGATAGIGAGGSAGAGTAGSAGAAGAAGAAVCPTDPNLVNTPSPACWVGCDPTLSTDNPMGIQGAFYSFGDGSSCPAMGFSPSCADGKGVCINGNTIMDSTYKAWGCGLGMELNSTGGTAAVKQVYTGSATCFDYVLTGTSGGQEVRIAFTQKANTANLVSPYKSIPAFTNGTSGTVCLKDVSCGTQTVCTGSVTTNCCTALTGANGTPYDFQVSVAGGNGAGHFDFCLSSLTPKGNGSTTYTQLCGAQGASNATEPVGKYTAQNNVTAGRGSLCITPGLNGTNASFNVDSAGLTGATSSNGPGAYPSIVDGWHYGHTSSDTSLPKLVSALTTIPSTATYSGSSNQYDAAYDIWVLPSANPANPMGGLEVMVWLNSAGVQPSCCDQNTKFNGYEVWKGPVGNWTYVAYQSQNGSFNGDLAPFIKDAVSRAGMNAGQVYLAGIEFGFELWQGGQGMKVTSFNATVN